MICVTGDERTPSALRARLARHPSQPLQELRLDLLERVDDEVLRLIGPQHIVTCRPAWEGGGFAGDEAAREKILRRALERQPGYLDLEARSSHALRRVLQRHKGATRLILSWHGFEPAAPEELRRALEQAPEGDLLKLAVAVRDAADLLPLLELAEQLDRPALLIGMGPAGLLSRALYHRFGSPWTYVAAQGCAPVAPGQLELGQALAWRLDRAAQLTPLGLLGGPQVMRSPGPWIYNALFRRLGLPLLYLPVLSEEARPALELCQRLGFAGLSVTMPVKRDAADLLEAHRLRPPADALGAVNTLVREDDGWTGHNTDVSALRALLAPHAPAPALVLGAGGAALAAAHALGQLGCDVAVCARDTARAEALTRRLGLAGPLPWEKRGGHTGRILVNATPVGSDGLGDPMPPQVGWEGRVVLDAVIADRPTPLLRRARRGGAMVLDGRAWWLHQGSRQMELVLGRPSCVEELLDTPATAVAPEPLAMRVPGSKSQTQRALILAALARGQSELQGPLECDDSRVLRDALRALGVEVTLERDVWRLRGGALKPAPGPLWCGEAGTTSRFLAPLSLLLDGELCLDGSQRLRERPLGPLLEALARLGVQVRFGAQPDALPLCLRRGDEVGASTRIDVGRSSQFLSGLLMVAPRLPGGLTLEIGDDPPVSRPYVAMTLRAMKRFGATVTVEPGRFRVPPAELRPCRYPVEGDWSAAAFLLAAARLAGREVRLENLADDSVQGDRAIIRHLQQLDRPGPHRFDLSDCPDLIAPLAAAAVTALHPVEICGVAHARLKESDRVAVLVRGLRQAGLLADEQPDGLTLRPGGALRPARLDPAGDHRMAMAFGLLALREPGIVVADPTCVSKSFPDFWDELERLR